MTSALMLLRRLNEDQPIENNHYFIFGDFNFRIDVKALVEVIIKHVLIEHRNKPNRKECVRIPALQST